VCAHGYKNKMVEDQRPSTRETKQLEQELFSESKRNTNFVTNRTNNYTLIWKYFSLSKIIGAKYSSKFVR
jgi:hypothetical protein